MRVTVDHDKCHGHARCHSICPDVFDVGEVDGKSRVLLDPVPRALEERAARAADACPEEAITAHP